MALTQSNMTPLGSPIPDFKLKDVVSGEHIAPQTGHMTTGILVMFICNHCPYVVHIREELVKLANELSERRFQVVAINSNSIETHPQDGPEHMKALAEEEGWQFPFCFDESQEVAKAFGATCTPDFFLYGRERRLFYRGQFDETRPGGDAPTGKDLRDAIMALTIGNPGPEIQVPSMGCGIKWQPGNAPS